MRIFLAKYAGYCYGVQRAVDLLDSVIKNKKSDELIFTLGPIIHNSEVVSYYDKQGVGIIKDLDELLPFKQKCKVVIRSHGVPKEVYDLAAERGIEIFDATCPYVKKIQQKAFKHQKEGNYIIVAGSAKHPEIIGIKGWAGDQSAVIDSVDDIKNLSLDKPVCAVCQTTYQLEKWQEMRLEIERLFPQAMIYDTICHATEQRQKSCVEVAKQVDLMIVVGGKESSNTRKLVELSKNIVETIHIETKNDFEASLLHGKTKIGITAGASTPAWVLDEVILKIENEGEVFF